MREKYVRYDKQEIFPVYTHKEIIEHLKRGNKIKSNNKFKVKFSEN